MQGDQKPSHEWSLGNLNCMTGPSQRAWESWWNTKICSLTLLFTSPLSLEFTRQHPGSNTLISEPSSIQEPDLGTWIWERFSELRSPWCFQNASSTSPRLSPRTVLTWDPNFWRITGWRAGTARCWRPVRDCHWPRSRLHTTQWVWPELGCHAKASLEEPWKTQTSGQKYPC